MGFDLGAGLASMGQSVSASAATAGLEMQKADLENQKTILADKLATTRESVGRQEQGAIAATAASKLADVNAAAAKIQDDFQTGLVKLQGQNSLAVANVSASAEVKAAAIQASASMTNVKAQLAEGDIQVGPSGTLMKIDRSTGKATPVTGDDGQPVQGIVPGQAALLKDAVNANNDRTRMLTLQYRDDLKGPQQELDNLTKPTSGATPEEIAAAKAEVQKIQDTYKPVFKSLDNNMNSIVMSISNKTPGGAAPTAGAPTLTYDAKGNLISGGAPAPAGKGLSLNQPAPTNMGATSFMNGGAP